MSEEAIMTINSEEKKEKEGYNEENKLNGDLENNTAENNQKEMDYKNKQPMEVDDENNDKVNKNTAETNKEEKDNGAINKLKEIDNVSNIESHVDNEIPLIMFDDEEDDNTFTIKVVKKENTNLIEIDGEKNTTFTVTKPLEINDIVEKKIENNAVDEQLKDIDTVAKSIEKNPENNIFETMNNTENKITVTVENKKKEKDNGAINKLKEIDNVSNIESHVEDKIPLVILDDEDDNTLTIKVVKKDYTNLIEIDGEKNTTFTVTKSLEINDIVEKKIENNAVDEQLKEIDTVAKSIEKNAENNIFDTMNNTENKITVTVENKKEEKDNGAINKLKEIDNVSNIENHVEDKIPLVILDDEEDDNTLTIKVVKKDYTNLIEIDGDNDTTFTDNNSEDLELGENMIQEALLLKDNEQKSENNADKNSDEREIKLVECNGNPEEEIPKKRKNDQEKGPQKRTKSH